MLAYFRTQNTAMILFSKQLEFRINRGTANIFLSKKLKNYSGFWQGTKAILQNSKLQQLPIYGRKSRDFFEREREREGGGGIRTEITRIGEIGDIVCKTVHD